MNNLTIDINQVKVKALEQQIHWPYGRKFKCKKCNRVSNILIGTEELLSWKLRHINCTPKTINLRK